MNRLAWGTSLAAMVVAGQPVLAQSATAAQAVEPPVATPGAAATAPAGIADIVVTAQRVSQSSQRAGIAIDVVSPSELTAAGVVTATTLNNTVPSLIVTKAGGANTSFFVRGVGNFTVNAYADPAIAFNVDGVYLGRPTSTTGTFFDLDRIEVLKGPQGTLYGRNATGGAVNVIPAKPKLNELSGYVRGGYGNFNAVDGEAAINIPIGTATAIRVSGKIVNDDGYFRDGTNDEVGQAVRAQVLTRLTDTLTVRVAGDFSHQGGVGPGASFNGVLRFSPGSPATATSPVNYTFVASGIDKYDGLHTNASKAFFRAQTIPGAFINPGNFTTPGNYITGDAPYAYPRIDNRYYGVNAEVTLDTGIGQFTFIPAYRRADIDQVFNGPAFAAGINSEKDKQFSAELRLQGKSIGPVDWLVGAYYFDESIRARYTFSQYQINAFQDLTTGTESKAAFGRIVLRATDALRFIGGARYTEDKKRFDFTADTLVEICANAPPPFGPGCFGGPSVPPAVSLAALPFQPIPTPNRGPVPFGTRGNLLLDNRISGSPRQTFDRFTYKVGAEYDLGARSLVYLSYETGFRSGGFSASSSRPTYQPEYITALTLGSKNRFFDNQLQLNVELFRWKYTNQQVTHFGAEADGTTNLFTENLGRSTIQGVDVDTQWLATPTTLLRGSIQYLDNKIDSFTYTNPFGGVNLPPVTGCPFSGPANAAAPQVYTINCAGQTGYNSPKLSLNAGIDQTVELGAHKLVLSADARYRSNRIIGFERLQQQNSGSNTTVDLSATYAASDDRWGLTAYVRNVGDVAVASATQFQGTTAESISTVYGPPRTYGVRGSFKF